MSGSEGSGRRQRYWQRYWERMGRAEPGARSPRDLYADRILALAPGARWLDAGCGRESLPAWRREAWAELEQRGVLVFGCDLDVDALRHRIDPGAICAGDLAALPFADASFDLVSSNMVFEHLTDPVPSVRELVRVTRPGGRILVHTVNARHYLAWLARLTPHRLHEAAVRRFEGRGAPDVYPTRYRANTAARLEALFANEGCRRVWGGATPDLPLFAPVPGLFRLGLAAGLLERRLARGRAGPWLASNLLVEFERSAAG